MLRVGRHFRIDEGAKIIVGRDEKDNNALKRLVEPGDYLLCVDSDHGSPLVLAEQQISGDGLNLAAALCARYSAARTLPVVRVGILRNDNYHSVQVTPAKDETIDRFRIQPPR